MAFSLSYSSGAPPGAAASAVLDELHNGDMNGALGTIRKNDQGLRAGVRARLRMLRAFPMAAVSLVIVRCTRIALHG